MPQRRALAETIKEEVLAELGRHAYNRTAGGSRSASDFQNRREMVDLVKAEVLEQIEAEQEALERQKEMGERYNDFAYSGPAGTRWGGGLTPGERHRLKQEVLWALRNEVLSDGNIDRILQQHHRNLGALRGDIRRGLESVRDIENRVNSISDPQVREAVHAIVREAREEGLSLDQVIRRLNDGYGSGWGRRVGDWFNSSQGRGFLWGIGATAVAAMLFPVTRKGLRNIAVKTMEGTMEMADNARAAFERTKEGFEDMIAEANFHSMQEAENTYSAAEESNPDHPADGEPVH